MSNYRGTIKHRGAMSPVNPRFTLVALAFGWMGIGQVNATVRGIPPLALNRETCSGFPVRACWTLAAPVRLSSSERRTCRCCVSALVAGNRDTWGETMGAVQRSLLLNLSIERVSDRLSITHGS